MKNSKISNSLSYFLEQALILERNSLETVSKVSDAVTSQKDTVTITLTDPNNPLKTITYSIPSFGYLKSEIERLDNNIKTLSNLDSGTGSNIRLSDGSYRKIIASKVASEAPTITTTNNITNFNFKSNWLFEDMMNPYLYANVDLSNSVPVETERVLIQRYILNCTNTRQIEYFNNIKNNSTKINYKSFLKGLLDNGITYVLDENYYDLPPLRRRYSGEFTIERILENTLSPDGKNIVSRLILKNILYTDNNSGIENTVTISKNDILEVKETPVTTRYMVTYVDTATNEIKIKRLEGYSPITNETIFKISSNQVKKINVEIPVSFDRREVIFVKSVDPDSNIPSNKWSPGIAFYSNNLKYTSPQGVTTSLETFYQKNVVDFGNIILSYSKDYYPSIVEGIKPDAPVLHYDAEDESVSDFKIVQINKQLEEGTEANTFKKLIADKENALSQINNNNKLVEEQKELIQTTKFSTTTEKLNAQNKLAEYIKNQGTYTSLYNSIVNQIKSQYAASYMEKPKYRVRGFWSIPSPKISNSSGPQQIIQFKVRYRYLSESGIANREEEFTYLDGTTNATGRFSNWNEVLTPMRRRVKGSDGTYMWERVNTADPDQININQLDLPIQNGEQIEIQIKSISEAGFPSNPMESDWSEPVIVAFNDFPELQGDDISEIIAQNRVDASVANVVDNITGNTYAHMASSFYTNDKYFAHNAESITSGFLSPEQTPITLYDKLYDLQNQISAINEQLERMSATLEVKLIDGEDNTKVYTLTENGTTYINAGNYIEDKSKIDANKQKGAIITKTYYIEITSDLQSGLEILSKIPGDRLSMCPNTINNIYDIIDNINYTDGSDSDSEVGYPNDYKSYDNVMTQSSIASDYYKYKGRYDLVPINLSASDIIDYQICSPNMYQSAQCKGQFIYSRFRNVSDTFDMYVNTTTKDGVGFFDPTAQFTHSENIYEFNGDDFWIQRYNLYRQYGYVTDTQVELNVSDKIELYNYIIGLYNNLTGSSLARLDENSDFKNNEDKAKARIVEIEVVLNRLPKTFKKTENALRSLYDNSKVIMRLNNLNSNDLTDSINKAKKIKSRSENSVSNVNSASINKIEPKIQSAYGFADFGKIKSLEIKDDNDKIIDDGSFVTTHKIGYENIDRYRIGENSCDSYLFLSPLNHSSIQVNGDSNKSNISIKANTSIKVPIIYQYRMEDYNGNIFGNTNLISTDKDVKNTKYANIIGVDIWLNTLSDTPKQYDIVVYSTYDKE